MAEIKRALRKADEWITNALIGVGYGITNQLEGLYQMAAHPVNTLQGLGAIASQPREIPGMVANALVDTAKRATSGPLGFGEVIGENLSPSMFRRNALTRQELTTYHSSPHRINNVDEANPLGKFDLSKIGTGEGAQAYGHGIYLSEDAVMNRNNYYNKFKGDDGVSVFTDDRGSGFITNKSPSNARRMAGKLLAKHNLDYDAAKREAMRLGLGDSPDEVVSQIWRIEQQAKAGAKVAVKPGEAHFYTVDLPDEHIANMLDWDAPLSEQPEAVKWAFGISDSPEVVALEKEAAKLADDFRARSVNENWLDVLTGSAPSQGEDVWKRLQSVRALIDQKRATYRLPWINESNAPRLNSGFTGKDLYEIAKREFKGPPPATPLHQIFPPSKTGGAERASETLRSVGIPGIKYFDGNSRAAGEGTRNFVIFDPDTAKILKRE